MPRSATLRRTPTHAYVSRPHGRTARVRRFGPAMAMVAIMAACGGVFAWVISGVAQGRVW